MRIIANVMNAAAHARIDPFAVVLPEFTGREEHVGGVVVDEGRKRGVEPLACGIARLGPNAIVGWCLQPLEHARGDAAFAFRQFLRLKQLFRNGDESRHVLRTAIHKSFPATRCFGRPC